MSPASFEQQNLVYGKPETWTDEQCSSLPVWRGIVPIDGKGATAAAIISCWKLSKEDIEDIQRTGVVWLQVCAPVMVPVSLYTQNPFENGAD